MAKLAGKSEHLKGLLKASVKVHLINEKHAQITNISDNPFKLTIGDNLYTIPARKSIMLPIPNQDGFTVQNCHIGHGQKLTVYASDFWILKHTQRVIYRIYKKTVST